HRADGYAYSLSRRVRISIAASPASRVSRARSLSRRDVLPLRSAAEPQVPRRARAQGGYSRCSEPRASASRSLLCDGPRLCLCASPSRRIWVDLGTPLGAHELPRGLSLDQRNRHRLARWISAAEDPLSRTSAVA